MVKYQICKVPYTGRLSWHPLAVGVPACTSLTREVFVIESVRDGGKYSQSEYAFRKTSFSLETLTLRPNGRSTQRAKLISSKLYASPIYGQGRAFYSGLRICSGTPGIYTQWRSSLYIVQRRILCLVITPRGPPDPPSA